MFRSNVHQGTQNLVDALELLQNLLLLRRDSKISTDINAYLLTLLLTPANINQSINQSVIF